MFNGKRIDALETEIAELRKELAEATTMKVGDIKEFQRFKDSYFGIPVFEDGRPKVTAIQLIEMLMSRQKLEVQVTAETTTPQAFSLVKS
jgi:hypothetical protein